MSQIEIGNTIRAVHQALGYDPDALRRLGDNVTGAGRQLSDVIASAAESILGPARAQRTQMEAAWEANEQATTVVDEAAWNTDDPVARAKWEGR